MSDNIEFVVCQHGICRSFDNYHEAKKFALEAGIDPTYIVKVNADRAARTIDMAQRIVVWSCIAIGVICFWVSVVSIFYPG